VGSLRLTDAEIGGETGAENGPFQSIWPSVIQALQRFHPAPWRAIV
jgi:hypothetical protein